MDLAVMPRPVTRKAAIGEHLPAGVARFFTKERENQYITNGINMGGRMICRRIVY